MSIAAAVALRTLFRDENFQQKFTNAFGGRVWLERAPADERLPLCVYRIETSRFEKAARGVDHIMRVVFQMFGSADSTAGLVDAQEKLRTLLDGTVLEAEGYDRLVCILRQHGTPVLDDDAWLIEDEYELRGTKTN